MTKKRSTFRQQRKNRDLRKRTGHGLAADASKGENACRAALARAGMEFLMRTMPKPHADPEECQSQIAADAVHKRCARRAKLARIVAAGGAIPLHA